MRRPIPLCLLWLAVSAPTGCVWFSDLTEDEEAPIREAPAEPAPFRLQAEYDFPGSKAASDSGHAALAQGLTAAAIDCKPH